MQHPITLLTADCWFLTGATAAGKTSIGVELARRIGAEIISMDSMALYRGMDIGTAKPPTAERLAVPHHLIDIIEPHEDFSLASYVEAAGQSIEQIRGRGRQVLFVGGTPLYLKGLLRGIFEGPAADWDLRRTLQQQADEQGPDWLHRRLAEIDPVAAGRLHPNDSRAAASRDRSFRKDGPPDQRAPATVRDRPGRRAMPCVRRRLAKAGTSRADRPARRDDVHPRSGRGGPAFARKAAAVEQDGPPSRRLLRGHRAPRRLPGAPGDHRMGADPHPATRQAADHLVSQFERMPIRGGLWADRPD